mgnify:CR=1 FL=1
MITTRPFTRLGLALAISLFATSAMAARMSVYKNPWCGCCEAWVDAMRAAGHDVTIHNVEDLDPVKRQAGVPADMERQTVAVRSLASGHDVYACSQLVSASLVLLPGQWLVPVPV